MIFIKYKGREKKINLFHDIIIVVYNIIVLDVCVKSFSLTLLNIY